MYMLVFSTVLKMNLRGIKVTLEVLEALDIEVETAVRHYASKTHALLVKGCFPTSDEIQRCLQSIAHNADSQDYRYRNVVQAYAECMKWTIGDRHYQLLCSQGGALSFVDAALNCNG